MADRALPTQQRQDSTNKARARQALARVGAQSLTQRVMGWTFATSQGGAQLDPLAKRYNTQLNRKIVKNSEMLASSSTSVDKLNVLASEQNELLEQIIRALKQTTEGGDLGGGEGRLPRRPGRGRFGNRARQRLQRMQARQAARARAQAPDARRVARPPRPTPTIRERATQLRERITRPFQRIQTPPAAGAPAPHVEVPSARPPVPQVPSAPRPPVPETPPAPRPPAPQAPPAPRPPAPETIPTPRVPDVPRVPAPSAAGRVGSAARTVLRVADRILAPMLFLDMETALRDMGDRAEYLPANRLLTFRRTLLSAQQNVETYNQLLLSLEAEQDPARRAELEKDIERQHAIIVGQRNRLLQMATQLDAEAQAQYQRRIRRSQNGRVTTSERIVQLMPIARYVLGDERDTSLEAVRRPSDFRSLLQRALEGAPTEGQQPAGTPMSSVQPAQDLATPASYMQDFSAVIPGQNIVATDPSQREEAINRLLGAIFAEDMQFDEIVFDAEEIVFEGEVDIEGAAQPDANVAPGAQPPAPPAPTQQQGAQGAGTTPPTAPVATGGGTPSAPQEGAAAAPGTPATPPVPAGEMPAAAPATPNDATPVDDVQPQQDAGDAASGLRFRPGVDRRITPAIAQATRQVQSGSGIPLEITSGYRDPQRNARVGGAGNSAHLRGNAVDVHFQPTIEATNRVIAAASAAGIGGIGVYRPGWLHLDVESRRAWGPTFSADSIPQWAQQATAAHTAGRQATAVASAPATATELAQQGTQMVAGDQQQMISAQPGQAPVGAAATQPQQTPTPRRGSSTGSGEVPLNVRLQTQVA